MEQVTSFILAGGKSSRMGRDKGFCKLDKEEFIPRIAKCLFPVSQDVFLVSGIKAYDVFGIKRITDIYPGKGPIAGIHAALSASTTERNIILSCDVPFISKELIRQLLAEDEGEDVIQLATKDETMPLAALYKTKNRDYFESLLKTDMLKLKDALKRLKVKNVQVNKKEERLLANINTPQELKEINYGR